MRILFLNQYFPPDPAPTGVLFREVADEFVRLGHEVDFVDAGQVYREGQRKAGRMKRELTALRRMLREGCARSRADVVISGSSPPCLAVVADRVARKHGAAHFHWAMDVYPEIAVELGEVRRGSLVGRVAGWAMRRAYRRARGVVALDADMAACFRGYGVEPVCIRPWVPRTVIEALPGERKPETPWTWIYSGNLGRAHEWETLLRAQELIEARGVDARLLFQGGGPSWPAAQALALKIGLRRCEWHGYVPEADLPASLLRCQVLIATQLPAVRGLLWPSKLALISAMPRGILFVGPPDGAIARELRGLGNAGVFAPGDADGVAGWIQDQRANPVATPWEVFNRASERRGEALAAWRDLLTRKSEATCRG
jgi:glycosyltransferase involved in cell wall biosynthesis